MKPFHNCILKTATFNGMMGCEVSDVVSEVFEWFYNGEGKGIETCMIQHLNGVRVTFEREKGDSQ